MSERHARAGLGFGLPAMIVALLLAGCGSGGAGPHAADALPGPRAVAGWTPAGDVQLYDHDNLYDLVDGQADSFFAFNFQQAAVRNYENAAGDRVGVVVWQTATPADAYGLFAAGFAGTPVQMAGAVDADRDPGRRLAFWQDRYYVQIRALRPVPDADLDLFAAAVSPALPAGGERPALLARLPAGEQPSAPPLFFHEESSIQNELWLGGENILGLDPQAAGVLARYEREGEPAWLLLVDYPTPTAAAEAMARLQSAGLPDLVTVLVRDNRLGAAIASLTPDQAGALLDQALR